MDLSTMTLDIDLAVDIARPLDAVFEGALAQITVGMKYPDGRSMDLKIERWPGGRWFRDMGDNTGHLWGIVQVIKPPTLIEIYGPMFMSYPVASHLEIKLSEKDGGTHVQFRHRALGLLEEAHRTGVRKGWDEIMNNMKASLEG